MDIDKRIQKLPTELVKHILSYSYSPQPRYLLNDITTYLEQRDTLYKMYYKMWIQDWGEPEPEDKAWLANDIIRYINDYEATFFSYTDKFFEIFFRNPMLKNDVSVLKYFKSLDRYYIETQVNILLGLLLPLEREILICSLLKNE